MLQFCPSIGPGQISSRSALIRTAFLLKSPPERMAEINGNNPAGWTPSQSGKHGRKAEYARLLFGPLVFCDRIEWIRLFKRLSPQ